MRTEGHFRDGVPISKGGRLRILPAPPNIAKMDLAPNLPDHRILRLAYDLSTNVSVVVFVTEDINARLKADGLGLRAVDFEKQKIKFDKLYSGYAEATVSADFMDSFSRKPLSKIVLWEVIPISLLCCVMRTI
ncbi:MAG: PhoH-like ATPase [Candidatus Promineifilaceae bacterium]